MLLSKELTRNPNFNTVDKEEEKKLKEFVQCRMRGLEYESAKKGFAVTQYRLRIVDPKTANFYKSAQARATIEACINKQNCVIKQEGSYIVIDVPNKEISTLFLGDSIENLEKIPKNYNEMLFYVGESSTGKHMIYDLANSANAHFLIGGVTGSGKSVCLHTIILSLLGRYNESELQLDFIDLKQVAAMGYKNIPQVKHIVKEKEEALGYLQNLVLEMHTRNEIFNEMGCADIGEYNSSVSEEKRIPRRVVVIDEADTLLKPVRGDDISLAIDELVKELAAIGRSEGIHLIVASQKPVGANIPTSIKSNLSGRIALKVSSKSDSRVIIDTSEAFFLSGNGDAVMKYVENGMLLSTRAQVAFVSTEDKKKIQNLLRKTA